MHSNLDKATKNPPLITIKQSINKQVIEINRIIIKFINTCERNIKRF